MGVVIPRVNERRLGGVLKYFTASGAGVPIGTAWGLGFRVSNTLAWYATP
jgi:hypothetical protein